VKIKMSEKVGCRIHLQSKKREKKKKYVSMRILALSVVLCASFFVFFYIFAICIFALRASVYPSFECLTAMQINCERECTNGGQIICLFVGGMCKLVGKAPIGEY